MGTHIFNLAPFSLSLFHLAWTAWTGLAQRRHRSALTISVKREGNAFCRPLTSLDIDGEMRRNRNLLFFRSFQMAMCPLLLCYVILKFTYPWTAFLVVTPTCRCHVATPCGKLGGKPDPSHQISPIFAWHIWHSWHSPYSHLRISPDSMVQRHNSTNCQKCM